MPSQQRGRAAGSMQCLQTMRRDLGQVVKINRNRATLGELKMDTEFEEWLENDWFTSGTTSWEEYYDEDEACKLCNDNPVEINEV